MKVYSADVKIAATAYIVAENEEEAKEIFERDFRALTGDELPTGGIVDGSSFENLLEEAQTSGSYSTLSPSITFYGAYDGGPVVLSLEHEGEDD